MDDRDPGLVPDVASRKHAAQGPFDVGLDADRHVAVRKDREHQLRILRFLTGLGCRFDREAARSGDGRLAGEHVGVAIDVALFHVFVGEVRAEEAGRFLLLGDPPVAIDRRGVEPLLRGPACVRQGEQTDSFDFGGLFELDQTLGVRPPAQPPRSPRLLLGLPFLLDRDDPFGVLARRAPPLVHLVHDGTPVRTPCCERKEGEDDDGQGEEDAHGGSYSNSSASAGETLSASRAG